MKAGRTSSPEDPKPPGQDQRIVAHSLHGMTYNAVMTIPATAANIPRPRTRVTLSFRKTMASGIVTTDKADAMGVIRIASPIVNP